MAFDFEEVKENFFEYIQTLGFEPNLDNTLSELGMDSIALVRLFDFINRTFNVDFDIQMNNQTLKEIINSIVSKSK